jgi:hypothetical protein
MPNDNPPSIYPLKVIDLDVVAIINLYLTLHGGDFFENTPQVAYLARAFVTTLFAQMKGASGDNIIENLAKLGFGVSIDHAGRKIEITSTKHYLEVTTGQGISDPTICLWHKVIDGATHCMSGYIPTPGDSSTQSNPSNQNLGSGPRG